MRHIASLILKIKGWTIIGSPPQDLKKCVILAAPHTSMSDFAIGRLAYWKLGVPVRFLIKIEMFKYPFFSWLLKKCGGIPVERGKRNNLVNYIADLFNKSEELNVVITPEGTRKYTENWKKGFYFIALKANIPIVLGFVDYKKKEGGFGPILFPTGDFDKDFEIIQDFYRTKTALHPERFNLTLKE